MNRIDSEFAFQARELAAQIEDTLGDPPNRKNYRMVVDALLLEYGKGVFVEDVNFLSLALVDQLKFNNPQGLLASAKNYESGDVDKILSMTSAEGACANMLAALAKTHPDLTRQAIIVAFLHKNPKLWLHEDHAAPPEEEEEKEDENDDDVDGGNDGPSSDVVGLFDEVGD